MRLKREITNPRSALARCLILAGLVALYLTAIGAPEARAGTYRVEECTSTNPAVPDAQIIASNRDAYVAANNCPWSEAPSSSSGLQMSTVGDPNVFVNDVSFNSWQLTAPPGTVIKGVVFQYRLYTTWGNYPFVALINDDGSGAQYWVPSGNAQNPCGSGPASVWCPALNTFPTSARTFKLVMACGNAGSECWPAGGGYGSVGNMVFSMSDNEAPSAPALAGSLVTGGPKRGTERLSASLTDPGSGVASAEFYVNGGLVEHKSSACVGAGVPGRFNPCPGSATTSSSTPRQIRARSSKETTPSRCAAATTPSRPPRATSPPAPRRW